MVGGGRGGERVGASVICEGRNRAAPRHRVVRAFPFCVSVSLTVFTVTPSDGRPIAGHDVKRPQGG